MGLYFPVSGLPNDSTVLPHINMFKLWSHHNMPRHREGCRTLIRVRRLTAAEEVGTNISDSWFIFALIHFTQEEVKLKVDRILGQFVQ